MKMKPDDVKCVEYGVELIKKHKFKVGEHVLF